MQPIYPYLRRYEAHCGAMPPFLRQHMASQLIDAVRACEPSTDGERASQQAWLRRLSHGGRRSSPPPRFAHDDLEEVQEHSLSAAATMHPFAVIPGSLHAYDISTYGYMRHPRRYDRWLSEYAQTGCPPGYASDPDLDMSLYDDPLSDQEEEEGAGTEPSAVTQRSTSAVTQRSTSCLGFHQRYPHPTSPAERPSSPVPQLLCQRGSPPKSPRSGSPVPAAAPEHSEATAWRGSEGALGSSSPCPIGVPPGAPSAARGFEAPSAMRAASLPLDSMDEDGATLGAPTSLALVVHRSRTRGARASQLDPKLLFGNVPRLRSLLGRCALVARSSDGRLFATLGGGCGDMRRLHLREVVDGLACYTMDAEVTMSSEPLGIGDEVVGFAVFFGGCKGADVRSFVRGFRKTIFSRAGSCPHLLHVVAMRVKQGPEITVLRPIPDELTVVSSDWSSLAGFAPRGPADLYDNVIAPLGRRRSFCAVDSHAAMVDAFERLYVRYFRGIRVVQKARVKVA